jgi:hypothetical protein
MIRARNLWEEAINERVVGHFRDDLHSNSRANDVADEVFGYPKLLDKLVEGLS